VSFKKLDFSRLFKPYLWKMPQPKLNYFRSFEMDNIPFHRHVGSVYGYSRKKNKWSDDHVMEELLEKQGIDTSVLKRDYCLVPPDDRLTYYDIAKYFKNEPDPGHFLTDDWQQAQEWYYQYHLPLHTNPQVLSFDEVVSLMQNDKSATVFLNQKYKNKGELFRDPEFRMSYYQFIADVLRGEVDPVFLAHLKCEIRPRSKVYEQKKARAFIIAAIYHLMLDHQLNLDFDMEWMEHWFEGNHGLGFSLFNGQYHHKFSKMFHHPGEKEAFYDVGKWDKLLRKFLQLKEIDVVSRFYPQFEPITKFIPAELCSKFGFDVNHKVNTHWLRRWLVETSASSYIVLPRGEIVIKDDGQNSGNGRTSPGNTGCHKLGEFNAAIKYGYKTYRQYVKENYSDHTGDDEMFKGKREFF